MVESRYLQEGHIGIGNDLSLPGIGTVGTDISTGNSVNGLIYTAFCRDMK